MSRTVLCYNIGMISLPGLIDIHVHLRDPGQTHKENFTTGTKAALAGGFTTVFDMPNNTIPITTLRRLKGKKAKAKKKIVCDIGLYFGTLGDNLDEFNKVKNLVWGLKVYLNQTTGGYVIDKALLKKIFNTWPTNSLILFHAEDRVVSDVLTVAAKIKRKIHFCHVSSIDELKPILEAKKRGLQVSCGVTPHYLFLTESDVKTLGSYAKMRPPLRSQKDQEYLWKNLKNIDAIESDHAPHTKREKESASPPNGVPGLETTLPLLLTAVREKRLTVEDVIRLCHEGPRRILGLPSAVDTHIEVDDTHTYTISENGLFTKPKWSPFTGWLVYGKVRRVFLRGKKVFEDGRILVSPGFGKVLTPAY